MRLLLTWVAAGRLSWGLPSTGLTGRATARAGTAPGRVGLSRGQRGASAPPCERKQRKKHHTMHQPVRHCQNTIPTPPSFSFPLSDELLATCRPPLSRHHLGEARRDCP